MDNRRVNLLQLGGEVNAINIGATSLLLEEDKEQQINLLGMIAASAMNVWNIANHLKLEAEHEVSNARTRDSEKPGSVGDSVHPDSHHRDLESPTGRSDSLPDYSDSGD